MPDDPYSRVYWSVMDDPKFDGIREDVSHFGSWTALLVVAEMAYPASAFVPAFVPRESLDALTSAGLVERLSGSRYRIVGLAKEREKRSQSGRNAAAVRWQSERNADPLLAKQSKAETSKAETPLPLTRGRRTNGTNPRATGSNPRANGTSPRQEREGQKRDMTSIHDILERSRKA